MTDLWRLTATEAVAKLRKWELSPLELVEAAASRIEAVEPKINALPIRFFDEARDYAKRFKNERRDDPGWLAGLPMAVKDYNDVAGQLTTYGSPIFAENHGAIECFQVLRALLFADVRGDLLPRERSRINPDIVWNIEKGQSLTAAEIIRAKRDRSSLFHRIARFFDDHDLLVCPTVA